MSYQKRHTEQESKFSNSQKRAAKRNSKKNRRHADRILSQGKYEAFEECEDV